MAANSVFNARVDEARRSHGEGQHTLIRTLQTQLAAAEGRLAAERGKYDALSELVEGFIAGLPILTLAGLAASEGKPDDERAKVVAEVLRDGWQAMQDGGAA